MPIDPSFAVSGADWQIAGVPTPGGAAEAAEGTGASGGAGFGGMLSKSISALSSSQTEAAEASQALAAGTVTDPTSVVMAVERARLSMQLASQIRTKAVEAAQDIFHTQV